MFNTGKAETGGLRCGPLLAVGFMLGVLSAACAADAVGGRKDWRLDRMVPRGKSLGIPGVSGNASGLAFCAESGTFFVIVNAPTEIVELTADWKKKRTIRLEGFRDTEGIACMGSNQVVVAEEDRGTLTILTLPADVNRISRESGRSIQVDRVGGNQGLEGVTYDPEEKCFYVVKEKGPRRIYKVTLEGKVSIPWDIEKESFGLRDLSDLYFDPGSGHLVILSDESATAVECTTDGRELSRLKLVLAQAEGVTMDGKGNLHVCGEPSVWQSFSAKKIE